MKADLNSFAPVLHEATALADGKINLNAEIISNFFNQPFVVGVGTVLAASFIERKAEKYADKKIEVILLSFEIPLSFNDTFDFALQVVLESLETLTTKVDKITEHLGINATDP